jgi:hypothetical protein
VRGNDAGCLQSLARWQYSIMRSHTFPEFDVYVDSTAGTARFGILPLNEEGKQALLMGTGDERTPMVNFPSFDLTPIRS